jgi:hypothetical protein
MSARRTRRASSPADWVIAIPSYKRPDILRDRTLTMLREYGIPRSRIHVFVATPDEYARYKATLDPATYGHMHVAVPGMAAVRNFITEFFPVGKAIFNIDDDARGVIEWKEGAKRNEQPLRDLAGTITQGFRDAKRLGYRLFGFYPVANGYFMKPGPPTTDLRYIIGGFWGIYNPGKILNITLDDKEDYLRSVMMYLLDGGVIRYTHISPQFNFYAGEGGMQEERTMNRIDASARAMVEAFPGLVKLNTTKKSGKTEVRLRDSRPERRFGDATLRSYTLPRV